MDFPVRFTDSVFFFNVWNSNGIQLKLSLALNWKELCCEIFNVRYLEVFFLASFFFPY